MYNIMNDLEETVTLDQCIDAVARVLAEAMIDTERGNHGFAEEEYEEAEKLRGMVRRLFSMQYVDYFLRREIEDRAKKIADEELAC